MMNFINNIKKILKKSFKGENLIPSQSSTEKRDIERTEAEKRLTESLAEEQKRKKISEEKLAKEIHAKYEIRIAAEKRLTEYLAEEQRRKKLLQEKLAEELQAKKLLEKKKEKKKLSALKIIPPKNIQLVEEERIRGRTAEPQGLEELNKIYSSEIERLIYAESKSRSTPFSTFPENPKEEIELTEEELLAQRPINIKQSSPGIVSPTEEKISNSPSIIFDSKEVFPKKCMNCPDHKNYVAGEIHQCPDCEKWYCGRHYHNHIMKNHKSSEYTISSSENGSASYKFKK
jgi:hypothetical protein